MDARQPKGARVGALARIDFAAATWFPTVRLAPLGAMIGPLR
jgi:hypothetical protein